MIINLKQTYANTENLHTKKQHNWYSMKALTRHSWLLWYSEVWI